MAVTIDILLQRTPDLLTTPQLSKAGSVHTTLRLLLVHMACGGSHSAAMDIGCSGATLLQDSGGCNSIGNFALVAAIHILQLSGRMVSSIAAGHACVVCCTDNLMHLTCSLCARKTVCVIRLALNVFSVSDPLGYLAEPTLQSSPV